ncbi:hypothetical protein OQA88_2631 [Cercophora sp. LCS_1]
MPQKEFLFVNAGNRTREGHKISTTGRAFVIRKARAAQPWSTKSQNSKTTRAKRSDTRGTVTTPIPRNRNSGSKTGRSASAGAGAVVGEGALVSRAATRQRAGRDAARCKCCNLPSSACVSASDLRSHGYLGGRLDPFGSLAVALSGQDIDLLTYFNSAISPRLTPPTGSDEVEKYWLSVSLGHTGFLSGLLCLSALQMAVEYPQHASVLLQRFMHHRVRTIEAVQQDIADPQKAITNENIATVFNLLCIEENLYLHASEQLSHDPMWVHLQPTPEQRQTHMSGLKRMLALRGGVGKIGNARGLQAFIIRWVCTALGCRIIFSLPRSYMDGEGWDPDEEEKMERAFAAQHLLPDGLLKKLYQYPESSRSFGQKWPMAERCRAAGMRDELVAQVHMLECLHADLMGWVMQRGIYGWDALDMQNMFSIAMGEIVRWYLLNEDSLTAAENVVSMCLFIFIFIVGLGAHTACSPVPGILPRMRKQFLDPQLRSALREAGIDGWVALLLLIASAQNQDSGEYFFRYYMEMLAARSPPITTYEEFRTTVEGCMWVPAMDPHLLKAWNEVKVEWARIREEMETNPDVLDAPLGPRPWDMYGSHATIPMSSPYSTAHMKTVFRGM